MSAVHTPTPWEVRHRRNIVPVSRDNLCVAVAEQHDPHSEANAAFIVRAVNAHDDLVTALKEARADIWSGCNAQRAITKIDAALAKAAQS